MARSEDGRLSSYGNSARKCKQKRRPASRLATCGWGNAREDQSGSSRIYPAGPLKGFALCLPLKAFGAIPNSSGEYPTLVRLVKLKAQPVGAKSVNTTICCTYRTLSKDLPGSSLTHKRYRKNRPARRESFKVLAHYQLLPSLDRNAGWRRLQLCGLCSFWPHATRGFALRQPRHRVQWRCRPRLALMAYPCS